MINTNLKLDTNEIVYWFDVIRNNTNEINHNKILDAFYAGQLRSKCWLVNALNSLNLYKEANIYIFGGWIGILASMLFQCTKFPIGKIRSIDIDPECEYIADSICKNHEINDWRFKAITSDMANYHYDDSIYPDIVINTSTEHVTQSTYDLWYEKIPEKTLVVIQGNNYFKCDQHIRCSKDIQQFQLQNHCKQPVFAEEINLDVYTRYMCMWYK